MIKMKKKLLSLFLLVVLTIVALFIWKSVPIEGTKRTEEPILTDISLDELKKSKSPSILTGKVQPNSSQKIKVDTNKEVEEVSVKEGDTVTVGQELFKYKDLAGENALKEAEMSVAEKQKLLENTQNTANIEWSIYENLKKEAKSSDSNNELYQQQMKAQMASNEIDTAQLSLNFAESTYETAKQKLDERVVKSKINGQVKLLDNEKLQNLNNDSGNFMEIVDDSTLFVNGFISEFDLEKISVGQKVEIIDRKNKKNTWSGEVTKVAHVASETNQDSDSKEPENPSLSKYPFTVKITSDNKKAIIGSNVYIQLVEEVDADQISLPADYIFKENESEQNYVWKVVDNKIIKQKVTIEDKKDDSETVIIKDGLNSNDRIVFPQSELKEGMEVGKPIKTD